MTQILKTGLRRLGSAKALIRSGGPTAYPEVANPIERYDV